MPVRFVPNDIDHGIQSALPGVDAFAESDHAPYDRFLRDFVFGV